MLLRFMTKRNTNGNRRYLAIDTEKKVFCTYSFRMIPEGEEVSAKAIRNIRTACENAGYTETEAF